MQKPNRKRVEWVAIVKDKEDNNLTVEQITKMYNVTEASYIKWAGIFRKEKENLPVTETDVINLIERSLVEFDLSIKRIDGHVKDLEGDKKELLIKKANLTESLKMLKGVHTL